MKKKCDTEIRDMVITHDVKIGTLEKAMSKMADTANRIYIAVLACLMTFLLNILITWMKSANG